MGMACAARVVPLTRARGTGSGFEDEQREIAESRKQRLEQQQWEREQRRLRHEEQLKKQRQRDRRLEQQQRRQQQHLLERQLQQQQQQQSQQVLVRSLQASQAASVALSPMSGAYPTPQQPWLSSASWRDRQTADASRATVPVGQSEEQLSADADADADDAVSDLSSDWQRTSRRAVATERRGRAALPARRFVAAAGAWMLVRPLFADRPHRPACAGQRGAAAVLRRASRPPAATWQASTQAPWATTWTLRCPARRLCYAATPAPAMRWCRSRFRWRIRTSHATAYASKCPSAKWSAVTMRMSAAAAASLPMPLAIITAAFLDPAQQQREPRRRCHQCRSRSPPAPSPIIIAVAFSIYGGECVVWRPRAR